MSAESHTHLKYNSVIDGLRALAVLSVLFFHAEIGLNGGYVGVDVFFVISGYLITRLILKDLNADKFQLLEFWERRIRRIFPALTVVVVASLVAGWFLFLPRDFEELAQSVIAQALLVSNVYFLRESNYFAQAAELMPLLHTWSLAVEEQFYLMLPFLLLAVARVANRSLIPVILLLASVSFGLSVFSSHRHPAANFYLPLTRAWELLLGAALAALGARRSGNSLRNELLSYGGLAAIIYSVLFFDRDTRFPGVSALLPCLGTAAIIWANRHQKTSLGHGLSLRPLVFVGLVSYSLYLWHWPLLAFANYSFLGEVSLSLRLLLLASSFGLAVLSWKYVETPFRQRAIVDERWKIFAFAGVTTVALLATGFTIFRAEGFPTRLPAASVTYAEARNDRAFRDEMKWTENGLTNLSELGPGDTSLPIRVLVWGDSHAMAVMTAMDQLCKAHGVRGIGAARLSVPPLIGYQNPYQDWVDEDSIRLNAAVLELVRAYGIKDVLLAARWDYYFDGEDHHELVRRGLQKSLEGLKEAGVRTWILRQVPKHSWSVPEALALAVLRGRDPGETGLPVEHHREASQRQDPLFEGLAGPEVVILDPTSLFLDKKGIYRAEDRGQALYSDDDHLSTHGATRLIPMLEQIFTGHVGTNDPGQ